VKLNLDKTDRAILHELQLDGKLSNVNLSERINLSESACLRRVKILEDTGVIERYAMIVNQDAIGVSGNVFVEKSIKEVPEMMECYLMTGEFDYLLRVVVADASDYERIHHNSLTNLPGVARVRSSFTLRTITKRTEIPVR
jgi:DNA-binding Lrp family transcriptional regulator